MHLGQHTAWMQILWQETCLSTSKLCHNKAGEIANSGSAKWGKIKELAARIAIKSNYCPVHMHRATWDQQIPSIASPSTVYMG